MANLGDKRREYLLHELDERNVPANPFEQFAKWMQEALDADISDPTAMVLSTISHENKPSSRVVLLKNYSDAGFDFFTNYLSKKGQHLERNPNASLLFFWPDLEREIRIEGAIIKISAGESDSYFTTRPRNSQVAAWASPQSTVVPNRKTLKDWFEEMDEIHLEKELKRPPHWGGYRLIPENFEFWQGRENRMHDRIEYLISDNTWKIRRLAP
jgi:pyridoxamine 5'-phosphate oxidase